MSLFTRVVVAYDGSPGSQRALMLAIRLASDQEATLLILSVAEHVPQFAGTVAEVDEHVREQQSALRESQERAASGRGDGRRESAGHPGGGPCRAVDRGDR